ncbi:hypothetical protein J4Q44_G00253230 [Coregonus suidteri]|uniref:Uncharacterized protein n=1 Tax=Coregonus suidteri TaxID=861788 RepID=A0AAN8LAU0_9TELE
MDSGEPGLALLQSVLVTDMLLQLSVQTLVNLMKTQTHQDSSAWSLRLPTYWTSVGATSPPPGDHSCSTHAPSPTPPDSGPGSANKFKTLSLIDNYSRRLHSYTNQDTYLGCSAEILVVSLQPVHVVSDGGVTDRIQQCPSFLNHRPHC